MKHIEASPIQNAPLKPYINCLDYTVSQKKFSIYIDESSELLVTTPRPLESELGGYYDSESYISHTNTKASFLDKVYQIVRKYAVRNKVKLIDSFHPPSKDLLDIGAGTGDFLLEAKEAGWNIKGIEPNLRARTVAEGKTGIEIATDISQLGDQQFNLITMWHVLEHVPNLKSYIASLKSLLKPGGTLLVAVPNYKSYDANYYGEAWAAYDVPRHLWHFSRKAMRFLFQEEKMKVHKTLPMRFDSFYVSLLSEKYRSGRMNYLRAFYVGLRSNLQAGRTKEYSSLIYIIKKEK